MRNGPRGSYKDSANMHCKEMDAALAANPPEIVWVKNKHGVMEAAEIRDPHTERSTEAQAERLRAAADRQERGEARKAAVRAEQRRLDTTRLALAARREI